MFVEVGSISAQTETGILYKKHTFELGPEISYISYKEPGVMKEKGMMYGLVGSTWGMIGLLEGQESMIISGGESKKVILVMLV
jgi:hypothetical protein